MATAGPTLPSTGANVANGSFPGVDVWSNPSRVTADDGSTSDCAHSLFGTGSEGDLLRATGFSWPAGIATVTNVLVEAKCTDGTGTNGALGVRLNGVDAAVFNPPAAIGYVTAYNGAPSSSAPYIANTDTVDIYCRSATLGRTYSVDAIRVTLTYTPPGGGILVAQAVAFFKSMAARRD